MTLKVAQVGSRPDGPSRARRLMEAESEVRASVVGGELRTRCWTEVRGVGHDRQRRRKCWDDLWIEEQKKEKRKEMRGVRGSLGHLHSPTQDQDKVRRRQSKTFVLLLDRLSLLMSRLSLGSSFISVSLSYA